MDNTFVITVNIDGCSMQMKILRTDELAYRNAAKLLNERIDVFRRRYTNKDLPTLLKMVALEFAVDNQLTKLRAETDSMADILAKWNEKIEKNL